jgi:hypothetical protein
MFASGIDQSRLSSVYNGDRHIASADYLFATAAVFIPEQTAGVPFNVNMMRMYALPPWHD